MKKRIRPQVRFAVCLTDSEPDLEFRKIYKVLPDESAEKDNLLRVVDESGEDYLYPASYFAILELPEETEKVFIGAL